MRRGFLQVILLILLGGAFFFADERQVKADNIVVVLDPGHGGENEGGKTEVFTEKEITLKVAEAMKEELEKYEGITVYMTRTTDTDMSLKQRVNYANSVGADFFFCLHYNMSVTHQLYGAECWTSAFGDCYTKGHDFAEFEMAELTDLGLYDRGIKTRIGKTGKDYYGIIRRATELGIPAVIIEHCHMDNAEDTAYLDNDEWPATYGVRDATAVAKYFGLKSEELGVDYSTLDHTSVGSPSGTVRPDTTEPEYCNVDAYIVDESTGVLTVSLSAADADSRLIYYEYSLDGGETFEPFVRWPQGQDTISIDIQLPKNTAVELVIGAHNMYDLVTYAETIEVPAVDYLTSVSSHDGVVSTTNISQKEAAELAAAVSENTAGTNTTEAEANAEETTSAGNKAKLYIAGIIVVAGLVLTETIIILAKKKRNRRRK